MVVVRENSSNYKKYAYFGATAIIIFLVILGGWYGYTWHRSINEEQAYKDFAQTVELYNKISASGDEEVNKKLQDALNAFKTGAQRHKSSALYPFFVIYQANVLARLNNLSEAISSLKQGLTNLDDSTPLFYAYNLKLAQLKLATGDKAQIEEAVQLLNNSALKAKNPLKEAYQYFVAQGYKFLGQQDKVQDIINSLSASEKPSVWQEKAKLLVN